MSDRIASATLQPREERRLLRGHAWAYRNEFKQLPELEDGAEVDVFSSERRFVGRGFYQARGGIAVRVATPRQEALGPDFFAARLAAAQRLRERLYPGGTVYRWVFGESDGLPGLVIDRYGSVAVGESACAFYDGRREALSEALLAHGAVAGLRLHLPGGTHDAGALAEPHTAAFDGFEVRVPLDKAQKTGLFLDQRLNRGCIVPFAPGARVLDAHCHAGLWSLYAARAGAAQVVGVDTSAAALELARENAQRNGLAARCTFVQSDAEAALGGGAAYDVVILDPPALAKSRDQLKQALGRYQALNRAALKALTPGGVLITSSCSHFLDAEGFLEMLKRSASAAGRQAALLELRGAAPDHPVLLAMPETAYLKCAVLLVH